ncbi:MAG: hypothetical protein K0Q81_1724 [Paenibacillus sp.]|jgi:hypothetical protein|nr:hypothetical protein [Paenibacillus sp.]
MVAGSFLCRITAVQHLTSALRAILFSVSRGFISRMKPDTMNSLEDPGTRRETGDEFINTGFYEGLAVVVIGGLTTSTLLTLVIVPIIYERNEKIKGFFRRWFLKKEAPAVKSAL